MISTIYRYLIFKRFTIWHNNVHYFIGSFYTSLISFSDVFRGMSFIFHFVCIFPFIFSFCVWWIIYIYMCVYNIDNKDFFIHKWENEDEKWSHRCMINITHIKKLIIDMTNTKSVKYWKLVKYGKIVKYLLNWDRIIRPKLPYKPQKHVRFPPCTDHDKPKNERIGQSYIIKPEMIC